MRRGTLILPLLLSISWGSAHAQAPLERLFLFEASPDHVWFKPDDTTRGMTANPRGSVLVVDRNPVDAVYMLDSFTGEEKGTLNTEGIAGGMFTVNKIAASDNGRIYLCNLSTGNNPFKVYYYFDEMSKPFGIFEDPAPGARWGDDLAVVGTGSNTKLIVSGSDNTDILVLSDSDGDGKFTAVKQTPINPLIMGTSNLAFDLDGSHYWIRQSTATRANSHQFDLATGVGSKSSFASVEGLGPMDIALMDRSSMMALGPGIVKDVSSAKNEAVIINMDISTIPVWKTDSLSGATTFQNLNGSGDVKLNSANRTLHVLYTNNSISGWRIPRP